MRKTKEDKEKLFDEIIHDISENGLSLRKAVKKRMSIDTWMEMIKGDTALAERYARACELRADYIFDEMIGIADDSSEDTIVTEYGAKENKEFVNRSRLKIDTRKWIISKMMPKKYGDKLDITTDGEKLTDRAIVVKLDGKDLDLS